MAKSSDIFSEKSFVAFYNTYYNRFLRYAAYYVGNRQTAEDITHDAILYFWENREKFLPDTDVLNYLLQTVRHKCLNYLKHLQVEAEYSKKYLELHEWEVNSRIMTLESEEYSRIFTEELTDIITASLAKLPEQTQYIFIQNRLQERPRKEIAAELGVSLQKVDYHINKANAHLQKDLKDYLPLLLLFFEKFF